MELNGIKNIIFDLGDVIINIQPPLSFEAFRELLGDRFEGMEQQLQENQILNKAETAECSPAALLEFFQQFKSSLTRTEMNQAWNAMLLDIPKERIVLINRLSKKYKLFLLSNTNAIHLQFIDELVQKQFGMKNMAEPFQKAYYSHEMGLRKPNPQIFQTILDEQQILAEETLFIDDSEQHIVAAKALNLRTHHLLDNEDIINLFNEN